MDEDYLRNIQRIYEAYLSLCKSVQVASQSWSQANEIYLAATSEADAARCWIVRNTIMGVYQTACDNRDKVWGEYIQFPRADRLAANEVAMLH